MPTPLTFPIGADRFIARSPLNHSCAIRTRALSGNDAQGSDDVRSDCQPTSLLIDLVYELLDAHTDTVDLACKMDDPDWEAHTEYVRALQRRGHEILALSARDAGYTAPALRAPTE